MGTDHAFSDTQGTHDTNGNVEVPHINEAWKISNKIWR